MTGYQQTLSYSVFIPASFCSSQDAQQINLLHMFVSIAYSFRAISQRVQRCRRAYNT